MGDVARDAGVSQRTVSNVVSGYRHVAPGTRARVEESLKRLGYRPNAAARQLRSGRTGTVTLAVPSFEERYFADLAEAVIGLSADRGLRVLVETTGSRERELDLLRGGGGLLTDGVIMSAITLGAEDESEDRPDYPLVLVGDRDLEGPIDHVGIPNRKAARAAVEHLIAVGSRRIAHLGWGRGVASDSARLRHQGYSDALRRAGLPMDPALVVPADWSHQGGIDAVEGLVASGTPMPDGIFAMNDSMGLGVVRALIRAGLRVPEDVAVIGFDDIRESRFASPSLSSVSPSLDDIARIALDLVTEQADAGDGRVSQHRHVSFEVKARESTARESTAP